MSTKLPFSKTDFELMEQEGWSIFAIDADESSLEVQRCDELDLS